MSYYENEHDTPQYRAELARYDLEMKLEKTKMVMDARLYPYVFNRILQHCSIQTLGRVLRCSRKSFEEARPLLYQHVVLTSRQYWRLVHQWRAVVDREKIKPHPNPSLSITASARHILYLNIGTHEDRIFWPFNDKLLPNLKYLRLAYRESQHASLMPEIKASKVEHIIIRAETSCFIEVIRADAQKRLPRNLKRITLLTQDTYRSFEGWCEFGTFKGTVTIVFLPFDLNGDPGVHKWGRRFGRIMGEISKFTKNAAAGAKLEVVGLEYGQGQAKGTVSEEKLRTGYEAAVKAKGWGGERAPVTFRRFEEWLDCQEPGFMLDEKEEREFRKGAADLRRKWGDTEWDPSVVEEEEEVTGYYNDFGCWQERY